MPETSSIRPTVSTELRVVADRQTQTDTDRQTDTGPWLVSVVCIGCLFNLFIGVSYWFFLC